jgi:hypothetical protein
MLKRCVRFSLISMAVMALGHPAKRGCLHCISPYRLLTDVVFVELSEQRHTRSSQLPWHA